MMRPLHPILTAFVALTLACGGAETEAEKPATPVTLSPVVVRDLDVRIDATGQLLAKNEAKIAAEVSGQVTAILRGEGAAVEADEIVLELDPAKRELELDDARARLSEEQANRHDKAREVERIRKLAAQSIASQQRLDQSETALSLAGSRVAAARARLGVAERALADSSVRAPFGGRVARRLVSRGEFVREGTPLFELVALDPIEVEFNLAEVDSGRVSIGDPVEVTVAPFPDEVFDAAVTIVSPTIDPVTRTLRVKAELPNPDGRLKPGLFARVNLGVEIRKNVTLVPEEALLRRADGDSVFVVGEGNVATRVPVEAGVHRDGQVEVSGKLSSSDYVVSRGQAWLAAGQLVDPRNPDGTRAVQHLEQANAGAEAGEALP